VPEPVPAPAEDPQQQLEQERGRHQQRAQRFGVPILEPQVRESKRYVNPHGAFVTGFDPNADAEQSKRDARMARFGGVAAAAPVVDVDAVHAMSIEPLTKRIDPPANADIRSNVVHLYGTDTMNTNQVFEYFRDFGPAELEWLNDSSCNVIFADAPSASRALIGLSREIQQTENVTRTPWRQAAAYRGIPLLMRMATVVDVKQQLGKQKSAFLWTDKPKVSQLRRVTGDKDKPMVTVSFTGKQKSGLRKPKFEKPPRVIVSDMKSTEPDDENDNAHIQQQQQP